MRKNQYVLTVTKESNTLSYGCEIQAFTKKEFTAKAPAEIWAMMNNTTYEEQFYEIECVEGMSEQDQVDEFIMCYVDELGLNHGDCAKILYYGNFSDEIYYEENEEEIEMTTADAEAEADTKDEQEGGLSDVEDED